MNAMPNVITLEDGSKYWEKQFEVFSVKVYVPKCELPVHIINYGFRAPYSIIFEEEPMSAKEAIAFADARGLTKIAASYGGSVVFVYPTNEGAWEQAPETFFASIIRQSKISQYYKDGTAIMWDRFAKTWGDYYIRGAVLRTNLYGFGASADFIARTCLRTVEGAGLYGPGDITPACCILERLHVTPQPQRRDIPVVSVGNTSKINEALKASLDHVLIREHSDYPEDYREFIGRYRRMMGYLNIEDYLDAMGMCLDADYCMVSTSPDNCGDDKDTKTHAIGYLAYYNKSLRDKKSPLVLCFHGGGDSAFCMATVTGWYQIAAKHNFILVCVENHLNSTATETMELMAHLKDKYSIDETKIYATGFSMGGCKSWDMFQEYPEVFAAVAPMDATFEVGQNVYGREVGNINQDVIVPTFYIGGEITPLPELPFQAQKCIDRMAYTLKVNRVMTPYAVRLEEHAQWANPIWGISGDAVIKLRDTSRDSVLTLHLFQSENGCCYSIFGSVSGQGHECRYHSCENAWLFMNSFRRMPDGTITGGDFAQIKALYV